MSDISVIVLTYNADWDKLKMTLNSVLLQKDVDLQIIIADDGSTVRHENEINELFKKSGFDKFVIANMETNGGTVKNLYNGLQYADGAYIKPISPGDFLYNETSLSDWLQFMKQNNSVFCFGDAVYFNELTIHEKSQNNNCTGLSSSMDSLEEDTARANNDAVCANKDDVCVNIVNGISAPTNKDLFKKPQDRKKIFESYLLANDTILGAAIMAEKSLYKKYMDRIVGRLVYAEDYLARLLVFDGIIIDYYPEYVIWYEYGTGTSSSKSEKWAALLHKDFDESNAIISETSEYFDSLSKKYLNFLKSSSGSGLVHKIKKCVAFPGLVTYRMDDKPTDTTAHAEVDKRFLELIV